MRIFYCRYLMILVAELTLSCSKGANLNQSTSKVVVSENITAENSEILGITAGDNHLSRRICDSSFGEIRRQFEYKAHARGGRVLLVDTFFPSSKLCSNCGIKNLQLSLADRAWSCPHCGASHHRNINAAINIKNHAVSYTVASEPRQACGEKSSGFQAVKRRRSETIFCEAGINRQSTT